MRIDRARIIRLLCVGIVTLAIGEYLIATVGVQIYVLPARTDFASYYLAGVLANRGDLPYDQELLAAAGYAIGFKHEQFPFVYPPPFALAMQAFVGRDYEAARQVWMLVSTLAMLLALLLLAHVLWLQQRALGIQSETWYWVLWAAFVPAALNSTGLHNDVRQGSVGAILLLFLVLLAWAMMRRRSAAAGLALAAATLTKLTPFALLPYVAWRTSRRASGIGVLLLGLSLVPAMLHWGPGVLGDYVSLALVPGALEERPWPHNQSIDAFLSRLLVRTQPIHAPLDVPVLKLVLSIAVSLMLVVAVAKRVRRARELPAGLIPAELGLVVLTLLLVMKVTWVHTLTAMLFVWPALMMPIYAAAVRGERWAVPAGLAACAGFFLSSAHLPILWNQANTWPLLLVPGLHTAGLLVLWGAAWTVLRRSADVHSIPPPNRSV